MLVCPLLLDDAVLEVRRLSRQLGLRPFVRCGVACSSPECCFLPHCWGVSDAPEAPAWSGRGSAERGPPRRGFCVGGPSSVEYLSCFDRFGWLSLQTGFVVLRFGTAVVLLEIVVVVVPPSWFVCCPHMKGGLFFAPLGKINCLPHKGALFV